MASVCKRSAFEIFLRLAFLGYAVWMLWLLFGQRVGTQIYTQRLAENMNLKPFSTVARYVFLLQNSNDPGLIRHAIINLGGNVIMFVPLGFFLPRLFRVLRGFFRTTALCLVLILAIELLQLVTMLGTCDIDDLILNMAGCCVGYPLSKIKRH